MCKLGASMFPGKNTKSCSTDVALLFHIVIVSTKQLVCICLVVYCFKVLVIIIVVV